MIEDKLMSRSKVNQNWIEDRHPCEFDIDCCEGDFWHGHHGQGVAVEFKVETFIGQEPVINEVRSNQLIELNITEIGTNLGFKLKKNLEDENQRRKSTFITEIEEEVEVFDGRQFEPSEEDLT